MNVIKRLLPDFIAVIVFIVISFAYFTPTVFEGRILFRHDASEGVSAGREAQAYYERTGERTRWTNSIFGGMPTYQMSPSYSSTDTLKGVEKLYHLFLPTYVWYVFAMLLGFYILLRAFDFNVWLATFGAMIWAFSSYFFILIAAGHIWKFVTLAYIPPTIAGLVLTYKGKYLWGGFLTALFVALQIMSNHVQMSYYFLFVILFMVVAFAVQAYRKGEMSRFWKATGVIALAGMTGICINLSNLYHTYQYSKETMRSKSELVKQDRENQTKGGLERDYITQWSYGTGETFSLLIPNVKGGASVPLSQNEKAMSKANPAYNYIYNQLGQYWGEQPGTSGPVYVGAFVAFLFLLGSFIVKGPMKWALLVGTILSVLLSWGKNFMGFTDFFLDVVPMYDKFRAVSSILVIAEFTMPLLAIMALREIIRQPQLWQKRPKAFVISFAATGIVCLLFAIAPTFFFPSFVSSAEIQALQSIPAEQLAPLLSNLTDMRVSIFTSDAWRSFLFILIGSAILLAYCTGKIKVRLTVVSLFLLCLIDLWTVNKRYLYDGLFVPQSARIDSFLPSDTDKQILADKALDYRVLNLSTNTFNENFTAYWHKSIGGYHAAKLRRYQEMIEAHISKEMTRLYQAIVQANGDMTRLDASEFPVLNMLNTRYVILPLQGGQTTSVLNPYALGNAWFVDKVRTVKNANEEINALHEINPKEIAVVDESFGKRIQTTNVIDSTRSVKLIAYEPNRLTYEADSKNGGVIVFSEIYYPGWTATIDGQEAPFGRADYILRAMSVPAGRHTVVFDFHPKSLALTEKIAYTGIGLLVLVAIVLAFQTFQYLKKNIKTGTN
ncbi:YfhO family protein [Phocaeicola abscessus]|uniref:YfhO family protein n=1 Tax=Phocaeicola abscessus TaxID=555313 RepID=UPI0028E9B324|nr:YfhO family protein [Phocaeicola abscessus]